MRASPRRISPAGVVVVISVVLAVAAVVWVLMLVRREDSPLAPQLTPTSAAVGTPAASPTQVPATPEPTPTTVPAPPRGSLPDLLTYAPDRLADGSLPLSDVARYADIAAWMDARGIATPTGPDDPVFAAWEAELDNLALPAILATRGNDPVWEATYGFDLLDVHQVLAVGQAPDFVIILTGDFDPEALRAAWVRSGYQAVASGDMTLWSLFPGDSIDLSAPASRPALGSFNNVVLLEDGTLVAASRISRLETTLQVVRGNEPSLAGNEAVAPLLAPGTGAQDLVSAIIAKGTVLQNATPLPPGTPPATPATTVPPEGTPAASSIGAEVDTVLFGIDASVDEHAGATMTILLAFDEVETATSAVPGVERALRGEVSPLTGQPYTDRLKPIGLRIVGTGDGAAVLLLHADLMHGAADWLAIVQERDLGFMAWIPEEDGGE